jgi:hypothetical protein
MLLRRAARISLAVVLLALPASAQAQVVRPSAVNAGTEVPAGGTTTLTLRCPGAAVAIGAAVTRQGSGVTVQRSIPGSGAADWRFRASAAAGSQRRGLRAQLRCVQLKQPDGVTGARLLVKTRMRPLGRVAPASPIARRLGCGRGWLATGYGVGHGASGDVRVAEAVPDAGGWRFRLENTGRAGANAQVSVRCLKRDVVARLGGAATTLRFQVTRSEVENQVPAGNRVVRSSCRSGQFSVSAGVSFDWRDDIALGTIRPSGSRGGLWTFRQAGTAEPVRSQLVCLGLRSRFG